MEFIVKAVNARGLLVKMETVTDTDELASLVLRWSVRGFRVEVVAIDMAV